LLLRANFRGSDYVLRYADNQFLVLLPDTSDGQAHYALKRLHNKIDHWNLENEKLEIAVRHQGITCEPGSNLWENMAEVEEKLREMPASDEADMESAVASPSGCESS
jgi:GGDEF domain-containing protein